MFLSLVSLENTIDWLQAFQIRYEGGGPSGAAAAPSHACMSEVSHVWTAMTHITSFGFTAAAVRITHAPTINSLILHGFELRVEKIII